MRVIICQPLLCTVTATLWSLWRRGEKEGGKGLQGKRQGTREAPMWHLPTRNLSHKDLGEASGRKVIRRELQVVKVAFRGQDTDNSEYLFWGIVYWPSPSILNDGS